MIVLLFLYPRFTIFVTREMAAYYYPTKKSAHRAQATGVGGQAVIYEAILEHL